MKNMSLVKKKIQEYKNLNYNNIKVQYTNYVGLTKNLTSKYIEP